jgi:biotin transport system substrate-specific component
VGFLLFWPVAAFVVGWITERGGPTYKLHWGIVANLTGGIVVLYVGGIVGMVLVSHLSVGAAVAANAWYLVGDLAKVVVAALVARGVHAAYPGLLDRGHRAAKKDVTTV